MIIPYQYQMRLSLLASCLIALCAGCSNDLTKERTDGSDRPFQVPIPEEASDDRLLSRLATEPSRLHFQDVHEEVGIEHHYVNGEQGRVMIVETIGGGAGWLDFDRDGRWDAYLNQGGDPTASDRSAQPSDVLFRNVDTSSFLRCEEAARISERHYSQGVAIADFDNDGFADIYVSNVGPDTLWWNCGDGTFQEVAATVGIENTGWGTSAAWADIENDGDLDLYVCNYVDYDPNHPVECKDSEGRDELCNPGRLSPVADVFFENLGNGKFQETSLQYQLVGPNNRALGVAAADFDHDGWVDFYVANDTTENFLFRNLGNGRFEDQAGLLGCAVNREGATQASMGVAVHDYDGNGFLDILATHYSEESHTLYANYGPRGFQDVTALTGLHRPTLAALGFGAMINDFDQDGSCDLVIANGHVDNSPKNPNLRMRPQLFTLRGSRWFELEPGGYFDKQRVARAIAAGDYDNDGDWDLLIAHQNESAGLLQNNSARGNWLQISFVGYDSNRQGIGCRVELQAGEQRWVQQLCGGTSYCASHQRSLVFGLGQTNKPLRLHIYWPSGREQILTDVEPNQSLTLWER